MNRYNALTRTLSVSSLLCVVSLVAVLRLAPIDAAAEALNAQLFSAVREAGSGAALCGLGSTPLLTSIVRSLLDCSNQCVGLVSGGGNCSAFNYWLKNATCQLFAGWPICFDVQPYCTLYQVRELRAVLQTLGPSRHTIQGPV